MNKIKFFNILIIAALAVTLTSCNKWEDPEFSASVYTGPAANKTIADIKAMHSSLGIGAQDSICSYNDQFIVKATVVSSDEGGNCYKYITVQDETGGMEIAIDRSGLYNDYPVGQTVYINCAGLIVGDYHNKYQIGWKYNGSVGRIHQNLISRYISKDGLPNLQNSLIANPISVTGTNQLNAQNVNCLVKIDGCKFSSEYDGQTLATNDLTLDRAVTINGATITVRTSNYANFRNTVIHADKSYCLYGILTVYNTGYQLTLRTKDDIQYATESQNVLVQNITFNSSSLTTGGWMMYPANDAWKYQSYNGDNFFYHNASTTTCDDWLISPALTFTDLTNLKLYLDHQNNVGGSPADYYEVYYSTSYNGGTFTESEWTAFNPNLNNYPSAFALSNALNASDIGSTTFRIALRYHKNGTADGTRWSIRGLKFYKEQ